MVIYQMHHGFIGGMRYGQIWSLLQRTPRSASSQFLLKSMIVSGINNQMMESVHGCLFILVDFAPWTSVRVTSVHHHIHQKWLSACYQIFEELRPLACHAASTLLQLLPLWRTAVPRN